MVQIGTICGTKQFNADDLIVREDRELSNMALTLFTDGGVLGQANDGFLLRIGTGLYFAWKKL